MSGERKFYWLLLLMSGFGMIAMLNCGTPQAEPKPTPNVEYTQTDRFNIASHKVDGYNPDLWTITDKDSGCQYLFAKEGYAGGLVLMPHTCTEEKK
jgi:hypothetical protein